VSDKPPVLIRERDPDSRDGLLHALLAVQAEAPTLRKDATNPRSHRHPIDSCPDCGGEKLKRAKRCKTCANKARAGEVRTSNPSRSTGWRRARQARPLEQCEYPDCEDQGMDRHHIDGDPLNNELSNIAVYCRRHHMLVDGRLAAAADRAPYTRKPKEAA
jgi:hypothetical protein